MSSKWSLSLRSKRPKLCIRHSSHPYALHAPPISFFFIFVTRTIFSEELRSLSYSSRSFLKSPVTSSLSDPIFSSTPYSQTPSSNVPPSVWETKPQNHTKLQGTITILYISKFVFCDFKIEDNISAPNDSSKPHCLTVIHSQFVHA